MPLEAHEIDILMEMKADLGSIKASLDGLAGPLGRVTRLESDHTRQWWVTVAIAPTLAVMHALARKIGVQI